MGEGYFKLILQWRRDSLSCFYCGGLVHIVLIIGMVSSYSFHSGGGLVQVTFILEKV